MILAYCSFFGESYVGHIAYETWRQRGSTALDITMVMAVIFNTQWHSQKMFKNQVMSLNSSINSSMVMAVIFNTMNNHSWLWAYYLKSQPWLWL
jgi:hypothetical protein